MLVDSGEFDVKSELEAEGVGIVLFGFLEEDEAIGESQHDGAVVEGEDVSEGVLLHLCEEG